MKEVSSGLADLHMKAPSQEMASTGRKSVPLKLGRSQRSKHQIQKLENMVIPRSCPHV